jgi:hypothetical protein
MSDDNIIEFPGTTYGKVDPELILESAAEDHAAFDQVLVCGFHKDGSLFVATSSGEYKDNLYLLEMAKMHLYESTKVEEFD